MSMKSARVGLSCGTNRRSNVYQALDLVRAGVEARIREQVLLKPNFLSSKNQLASSHVDALRGAIDFLLSTPAPPAEIIIAEGGNEKHSGEAFDNFGYRSLAGEYGVPIRLVDLNQETEWVEAPVLLAGRRKGELRRIVERFVPSAVHTWLDWPGEQFEDDIVRMPKTVLDCPCTISVAVAKTHDTCVVTLALKNMIMGTLYKPDRIKMHGFRSHGERRLPEEAQMMSINLIRLARFLAPDIAVIDGTRGLQGNGPGGDNPVDGFNIAAASADVFAADAVMAKAMGFEPLELGFLQYGDELGLGIADLAQIEVIGATIAGVQRQFQPHESTARQLQWHLPNAQEHLLAR